LLLGLFGASTGAAAALQVDRDVMRLNRNALTELHCPKTLAVVADAGHLFEEPGALEAVARLASDWFAGYFAHH
jgi:putative phosphoribosyl transferase